MVTNAKIIYKHFLSVSLHTVLTRRRANLFLLVSTSSHVPLSFAWAPDPLVTIITFSAFLAGKRLHASMGPHVLISVCWAREPLPTNLALVVNHLKEK